MPVHRPGNERHRLIWMALLAFWLAALAPTASRLIAAADPLQAALIAEWCRAPASNASDSDGGGSPASDFADWASCPSCLLAQHTGMALPAPARHHDLQFPGLRFSAIGWRELKKRGSPRAWHALARAPPGALAPIDFLFLHDRPDAHSTWRRPPDNRFIASFLHEHSRLRPHRPLQPDPDLRRHPRRPGRIDHPDRLWWG
jgi:hypothetical protein